MWKEGAPNTAARPGRASCHNVARRVVNVDPGRELTPIGREAKRREIPLTVRKDG